MPIEWVIKKLMLVIPLISRSIVINRKFADNALRSVFFALCETCTYVKSYKRIGERNEETEMQLSNYWSTAAVSLRHFDWELSKICEDKNWLSPLNWDDAARNAITIDLEILCEKYKVQLIELSGAAPTFVQ